MAEAVRWYRPEGLAGVEALHANFERHAYRPHSHPTWTIAVVERGAAAFQVDARQERAHDGECFVLEPEAVHTGVPAVPEGWAYKVLYLEPELLSTWAERDRAALGITPARYARAQERSRPGAAQRRHSPRWASPTSPTRSPSSCARTSPPGSGSTSPRS